MSPNYHYFSSNTRKTSEFSRNFDPCSTNPGQKAKIQGKNEQRFRECTNGVRLVGMAVLERPLHTAFLNLG